MSDSIPLSTDYATERRRFLADAEAAGALIEHHRHPMVGPEGEDLATDIARFGAPIGEAATVLVISSGVHGVEGHAGSGLQHLLCRSGRLADLPARTAAVLVHSVNPYGHAWSRRVDHSNVDVNRNFLFDYDDLPTNALYPQIDHLLNPTDDQLDPNDTSFLIDLASWMEEVGFLEGYQAVSGGQYSHPAGVQFGGRGASWSRTTMERIWSRQLDGAARAITLDVHTGLGPMGGLTVFQTADEHEDAAELGRAWYSNHVYRADRTSESTFDHGLLGPGLDHWAANRLATSTFVVEFGTHDPSQGITAFRADNWLHHHGDLRSATADGIRTSVRDFFFVEDESWRLAVAEKGLDTIHTALDGISSVD